MSEDLRLLRVKANLTLDEVGRLAKIERSRLSRAERGYVTLASDELARLLPIIQQAANPQPTEEDVWVEWAIALMRDFGMRNKVSCRFDAVLGAEWVRRPA